MKLRKLKRQENGKTRALYENVFTQDTKEFLDYYYTVKTDENEIFVIEDDETGKLVSMLHLNPYNLRINQRVYPTNYIVAVATDENYRKRGLMGQLLRHTMRVMYERKEPFTFLMPAAEAIYYPYDFRFVYTRRQGELCGENNESDVTIRIAKVEDCTRLATFANEYLKDFQVTAYRDAAYYEMLIKEQESQEGGIVIIEKHGESIGMFFFAKGERYEIREPLCKSEADFKKAVYLFAGDEKAIVDTIAYGEGRRPIIMARILHLETLLKTITLTQDLDCYIELEDSFIEENNGVFHIQGNAGETISVVEKQDHHPEKVEKWKMGDFTVELFARAFPKVFLNEVV